MEALSVRDYRNNLAASFEKASRGETVLVRRKNQIFALVNVGREDLMLTPELRMRIKEAEDAWMSGDAKVFKTKDEIEGFLDSL